MSGLFHRLARQMTGQPLPRLHAAARLPYAPTPALLPEADMNPLQTVADEARAAPINIDIPRSSPETARTSTPPYAPPLAHQHKRDETNERHGYFAAEEFSGIADIDIEAPMSMQGPQNTHDNAQPQIQTHLRPTRPEPAQRATAQVLISVPPPLLAELSPGEASNAGRTGPTPPSPGINGLQIKAAGDVHKADALPEVHVHIGRIEVTAAREKSPPAQPKQSRSSTMSLDEYLAQRQRQST